MYAAATSRCSATQKVDFLRNRQYSCDRRRLSGDPLSHPAHRHPVGASPAGPAGGGRCLGGLFSLGVAGGHPHARCQHPGRSAGDLADHLDHLGLVRGPGLSLGRPGASVAL